MDTKVYEFELCKKSFLVTEALFQNWVMGKVLIRQVRKRLYFFVAKDGDFVTLLLSLRIIVWLFITCEPLKVFSIKSALFKVL